MAEELNVLGTKRDNFSGDVVLKHQEIATKDGFSHVSKIWFRKCMSYDDGMNKIVSDQKKIRDYNDSPLKEWRPIVNNQGRFALQFQPTGESFVPTEHALTNIGIAAGIGSTTMLALTRDKEHPTKKDNDGEPVKMYSRDRRDAEIIAYTLERTLFASDRNDQEKPRLFRTWTDGTMRAMLSDSYAIVNNAWVLDAMRKIIPGGLLSHWRGDADSIYGNILIPDTIRTETDSDYGGMLSIGNSEIGIRRISTTPSVFRAICMNGCIWDQESGVGINRRHKGEIDLATLYKEIEYNLNKQIPLLSVGIERVLGIRAYGFDGTPFQNIFAQTGQDHKLSTKQIQGLLTHFSQESSMLGKEAFSAFGLMNSVTRFGQTLNDTNWVRFDEIAGEFANQSRDSWDKFKDRAGKLQPKQVEKLLGVAA